MTQEVCQRLSRAERRAGKLAATSAKSRLAVPVGFV